MMHLDTRQESMRKLVVENLILPLARLEDMVLLISDIFQPALYLLGVLWSLGFRLFLHSFGLRLQGHSSDSLITDYLTIAGQSPETFGMGIHVLPYQFFLFQLFLN